MEAAVCFIPLNNRSFWDRTLAIAFTDTFIVGTGGHDPFWIVGRKRILDCPLGFRLIDTIG